MQIAGYEIREKLYQGKHFAVYRAAGKEAAAHCVIKVLDKKTQYKNAVDATGNEYQLLTQIDSEQVIKVLDRVEDKNYTAIVMEDIHGNALKELIENEAPYPTIQFLKLAVLITNGLMAIHRQNIIHRDINPANIIWNPREGKLKIIDFDIAVRFEAKVANPGNPERLLGTLPYLSPEQTGRVNHRVDQRSDLYSLGVTFYEMLTGKLPFRHSDPIEIVHAHLARDPEPPHLIHEHIPEILSQIVLKLLAKNPEERYQSVEGLKYDLEKFQAVHLSEVKEPGGFKLGAKDFSGKLQIPEKLYGRENEIKQLLEAYKRVTRGQCEMLLVAGYSGTGKTALVNEIHKPITKDRGHFIAGKFEQFQQNVPYLAFIRAISQFCDLLLTENQVVLNIWKQTIQEAVEPLGKVLTDIIPNLEAVIGKQPDVPRSEGVEAKNRFNYVFQRFIRSISSVEHPLVMFIDDLQWTDHGSLELLKQIMTDAQNRFFLFIGAYRDNEVSQSHHLTLTIEELRKQGVPVPIIPVKNLTQNDIQDWLRYILRDATPPGVQKIENLSSRIYGKTGGNAFFMVQFLTNLYKKDVLSFDFGRSKWTWDMKKIDRLDITKNVVDLLIQRLRTLPHATQEVLKFSSCVGNIFDLETLSVISGRDIRIQGALGIALSENLIYPTGDTNYKFVHDRIQQAAYTLISDSDKKPVHLEMGRLMLKEFHIFDDSGTLTVSEETEPRIFDIVNHFNVGIDLVSDEEERIKILRLNLKAGQKAKASTAFELGWGYIRQALLLLPAYSWQNLYDLTLSVYNEAIHLAYMAGNYSEMNRLAEVVLKFASKIMDKAVAYEYRIMALIAQNESLKAVDLVLESFDRLGIHISRKPGEQDMVIFEKTKFLLAEIGIENLGNLPAMKGEEKQLATRIYLSASTAIIFGAQELYPIILNNLLYLSLEYGITAETPYLLNEYSIFSILEGNTAEGFRSGMVAVNLLDRVAGHEPMKVRLLVFFNCYISHWKLHYKDVSVQFWEIHQRALNVGDFEYTAYVLAYFLLLQRYIGTEISIVERKGAAIKDTVKEFNQPLASVLIEIWLQLFLNLRGENPNPLQLNVDIEGMFPEESESIRGAAQFYLNVPRLLLGYLFENYFILDCTEELEKSPVDMSAVEYPEYLFFSSLMRLQLYERASKPEKREYLRYVRESVETMKQWSELGPMNFLHRYYLMQAELYRVTGEGYKAAEYYDKAIKSAREHEFLYVEALANEGAAKFNMRNHRDELAEFYFQKAWQCYRKWGAVAKVKHLEDNYPKYLRLRIPGSILSTTGTISSASTDTTDEFLDVKSIIKASQTLSGEVRLARLLEKMMRILVENAGAQKSMLIENIDDSLLIQAEGTADGVSGILKRQPVEESGKVPLSVINYVARSEKQLVFDNISRDPNYSSDDYIQKHQPKSVVCFPIVRKDKLTAIIYLENNLVEGAFTPKRMNILNTLSAQIAISIENARIYRDLAELNKSLEQKVAERTRQLEDVNKSRSRLFANISHEFRTPLTLIMGPLEKRLSLCRDEQETQEFRMMLRNSRRLLNLVNQLLDLARLESGKMKLEASRQNIIPFLKSIVMCFESLAAQEKVDLIFHKQEEDITVYFDPEKLEKIITNLLANAFTYTPSGGTITVLVRRLTANYRFPSGCVEISVRDTGTGIPRDQLPYIFDRFYRGEGVHEYKGKGAGIGLALTKELVDLHHGEIDVQSSCRDDDSRGSEFFLRLPMGEEHLQPGEMVEIKEPEESSDKPTARRAMKSFDQTFSKVWTPAGPPEAIGQSRETEEKEEKSLVLVVEDNADVRTYIRGSLEPQFKVVEAADGKEGILRAKEIVPDLIVSDVMMPGTDGFELCRTLKKDVLTCHVPIILLTARVSEESVLQGLETGADDYITKPFSTELLAVRVGNLIDLRRQLQLEQKNRMTFRPGEIAVSPLDDEFYKKLQDTIEAHLSDPDFSIEVLCRLLDMSQATLYRKIHALTGKSPTLFLRSFRIKRAAQLLQANAGSVAEVAVKVGFPDKSYFSRCFKEQFHCLPSDVKSSGVSEPAGENEINQTFLRGGPGGAVFSKSVPPGRRGQDTILVVEDSEDTRTYIRRSLEPDYHVVEAVDGSEGIARAMEIIPDLVISDIMMPGMDGYELCRALKQDVRSCHIPVVLLTARAAEESKIKGLELGADDYITKPFNTRILRARIKNLVQLRSHLQERRNREMTLLPVSISEPEIHREFMNELNAVIEENLEDPDFNVDDLAKKLYMSSATLYRKIQALSGEIPSEYIRSFRLGRAARLLRENFGSVTEVAFEVGFNSRTYFTKCFKEKFHQLPSVYMAAESG